MKSKLTIISASGFIGGIAVLTFSQALAIEPPPDTAEPPSALLNGVVNAPAQRSIPKIENNIPFIGIATASVPGMLADHLELEQGSGVIIRTVCPDSPAEKAGLSVNDIILSVGETTVGNPEALSSSIRERKPGDRVALNLIHKGKPAKVEVTLTERPADLVSGIPQEPMLEGIPQAHADRLRGLIEKNLGDFDGAAFPDGQMENSLRMMQEHMNRAMGGNIPQLQPDNNGDITFQQNSTITMMDNQGSIEIRSSSGDTEVTVRDEKNETIWSGPWNREEDKSNAPKDIRERIEKVNSGNGTGLHFRFAKPRGTAPKPLGN